MQTLTDIDRGSRRWMQLAEREKDVGNQRGRALRCAARRAFSSRSMPPNLFRRLPISVTVRAAALRPPKLNLNYKISRKDDSSRLQGGSHARIDSAENPLVTPFRIPLPASLR
jgi:hypothetical protein